MKLSSFITRTSSAWMLVLAGVLATSANAKEARAAATTGQEQIGSGVVISTSPGAEFRRLAPRPLTLRGGKRVVAQVISLRQGRIEAFVEGPEALLIHAPPAVNAICERGQVTMMRTDGETTVANVEGTTWLAGRKGLTEVAAGRAKTWKPGGTSESPLAAAPALRPDRTVWIDLGSGADVSELAWRHVPGAVRYEVAAMSDGRRLWTRTTTEPSLRGTRAALPEGTHQVRLRVLDERGIGGKWSEPVALRVVGVELPEGAEIDSNQVVRLGDGQKLKFRHAGGITVTASADGRFVRVGDEGFATQGDRTWFVWFRPSGRPRPEASIRVGPRRVDAKVTIEPKDDGRQGSPVFISVRVNGPAWLRPEAKVLLGIDPVEVTWKRAGSTLYTVLSDLPEGPGPWVLRVQVQDQYGTPIARDFRELSSASHR